MWVALLNLIKSILTFKVNLKKNASYKKNKSPLMF